MAEQQNGSSEKDPAVIDEGAITTVEENIQYTFKDRNWFLRAVTHRSLHPHNDKSDYERFEFLGDAVLDLAVAHLLLDTYPDVREGELSKMRAALVNTSSLAQIAREISLGPCIRLSRGELASGGADRPSILADVLEAIFGAIYREAGYDEARRVIDLLFSGKVQTVTPTDPKTELQEELHARGKEPPEYVLDSVTGPEHAPTFSSSVKIEGVIQGQGDGPTKKASQQAAAAQALRKIRGGV